MSATAVSPAAPAQPGRALARDRSRGRTKVRQDPVTLAITGVVVLLLILLVGLPLVRVLAEAFSAPGLKVLTGLFSSTTNRTIVLNTLVLGTVVGALGTAVGFMLA